MIYLLSNVVNENIIYLPKKHECTVGRKNCDILLNDPSISRLHAIFKIKKDEVTLEDCKSKYHTKHKGIDLSPTVEIKLSHLDVIWFGTLNSKFRFECYKFVVTSSVLTPEAKGVLKQSLTKCQGKYVETWSNKCTHLVVDKFMLTVKVLLALIEEIPIVTHDYFTEYVKSLESGSSPPDINKFNKPPITEQLLKSDFKYKYDPKRKSLFKNKVFVFLKTKSKKQMEDVIRSCGGSCISWEEEPKSFEDITNSPNEHLIIKCENDGNNEAFSNLIKHLAQQNKRHIPITEIALAIVQCSCEMNCNPDFNKASRVFAVQTQKKGTPAVLAGESQTQWQKHESNIIKTENVIPSTLADDWMEDYQIQQVSEKSEITENNRGVKRVLEEVLDKTSKKAKPENSLKIKDFIGGIKQKSNTTISASCSSSAKEVSRPTLKRKPDDSIEVANATAGPFSSIKLPEPKRPNTNQGVNPFAVFNISKPVKPTSETIRKNPFADLKNLIKPSEPRTIKTENSIENIPPVGPLLNQSDASRTFSTTTKNTTTSWITNASWKSKSSVSSQGVVKHEDPELAEISKAFEDCVSVVSFRPSIKKRDAPRAVSADGIKNFKKFKKVQPLHPQQVVINPNMLKKFEADSDN